VLRWTGLHQPPWRLAAVCGRRIYGRSILDIVEPVDSIASTPKNQRLPSCPSRCLPRPRDGSCQVRADPVGEYRAAVPRYSAPARPTPAAQVPNALAASALRVIVPGIPVIKNPLVADHAPEKSSIASLRPRKAAVRLLAVLIARAACPTDYELHARSAQHNAHGVAVRANQYVTAAPKATPPYSNGRVYRMRLGVIP